MEQEAKYKRGTPEWREFLRESGRLGGLANVANNGIESMRRRGRAGGQKLLEQRGPEFYSAIGKIGGARSKRGPRKAGDSQ